MEENYNNMPSSVVAAFYCSAEKNLLTIQHISGEVYVYKNVPENIYLSMKAAHSKGIFLNKHIKGKYDFEKISYN